MEFSKNEVWYETFISGMLLYCIWRRQLHSNVSDGPPYQHAGVSWVLEECFPRECWELNFKLERIFVLLLFTFEFINFSFTSWFCCYVLADLCFKFEHTCRLPKIEPKHWLLWVGFLPMIMLSLNIYPLKKCLGSASISYCF